MKLKKYSVVILVIVAGLSGYYLYGGYPPEIKLTTQEAGVVNTFLDNMTTRCIGRYLIDLPESFSMYRGSMLLEDNNWVADVGLPDDSRRSYIATKRMYYPAFEQFIKRRETEISHGIVINPLNKPYLKKIWELSNGMKGIIFERNEGPSTNDAIRILEGYIYTNGVAVKVQKESVNDTDPRYDKYRDGDPVRNYISRDVERMKSLFSRVTGRLEDDIPTIPGTCIADAFIATDEYGREQERISRGYSSDKIPGVDVTVSIDNFTKDESTVLERSGEIEKTLSSINGYVIRKGAFDMNGFHIEEMLSGAVLPKKSEPHFSFNLFINEKTASYKTPNLMLSLDNANEDASTYPQDEIIAFWDAITHTIRLRPSAF